MTLFKTGDRVEYSGHMYSMQGMTGTVVETHNGFTLQGAVLVSPVYGIKWDDGDYGPRLRQEELELIKDKPA
jgi:hypothetical protein